MFFLVLTSFWNVKCVGRQCTNNYSWNILLLCPSVCRSSKGTWDSCRWCDLLSSRSLELCHWYTVSKAKSPSGPRAFLSPVTSGALVLARLLALGGIIHSFQIFLPHHRMKGISRSSVPFFFFCYLLRSRSKRDNQRTVFERLRSSGGDKHPKHPLLSSSVWTATPLPTLWFFSSSSSVVLISSSPSSSWSLLSSLVSCSISKREILVSRYIFKSSIFPWNAIIFRTNDNILLMTIYVHFDW